MATNETESRIDHTIHNTLISSPSSLPLSLPLVNGFLQFVPNSQTGMDGYTFYSFADFCFFHSLNFGLYRWLVLLRHLRLLLVHVSWCDRVWPQPIVCWYNNPLFFLFPSLFFIRKFVTDCE